MERELLEKALALISELRGVLEKAYQAHDHDTDLVGGALLSSAKMFMKACEEAIIAISLHLNQKGSK